MEHKCTRREFFVGAAKVTAFLGTAKLILDPAKSYGREAWVGSLEVDLSLKENAPLQMVGGAIMVDHPNKKKDKIILYRKETNEVLAFLSKCTHLGGPVGLPDEKGVMTCKWHKAEFNLEGDAIKKPAKKVLKIYKTEVGKDKVTVKIPPVKLK